LQLPQLRACRSSAIAAAAGLMTPDLAGSSILRPLITWVDAMSQMVYPSWFSLPNSVTDTYTVKFNAFKARLDKNGQHQIIKSDFTAEMTGTRNLSGELIVILSFVIVDNNDADLEVLRHLRL